MKKATLVILTFLVLIVFTVVQCGEGKQKTGTSKTDTTGKLITPVPLPTNIVPGFHFPEDSNLVYKWINDKRFSNGYDSTEIYKHAWGIWAGLTAASGQTYGS